MIHFKSKGFTLVEALVALAIMATVLIPLFMVQSTLFSLVRKRSLSIDRLLYAKKFMYEMRGEVPDDAENFEKDSVIKKPKMSLKYTLKQANKEGVLKKIPNMYQEMVTIEWEDGKNKRTDVLVNMLYRSG